MSARQCCGCGWCLPTNKSASPPSPSTPCSVLVFGATPLFDFSSNKPVLALYAKMKKPHSLLYSFSSISFFLFVCPFVCAYDSDVAVIVNTLGELDVICRCRTRHRHLPIPPFISFSPALELQGRQGEAGSAIPFFCHFAHCFFHQGS